MQSLGKAFSKKFFTDFAEGIKLLLVDFSIHSGFNVLKCTLKVIMILFNTYLHAHFYSTYQKSYINSVAAKTYIPEGKSFMESRKKNLK